MLRRGLVPVLLTGLQACHAPPAKLAYLTKLYVRGNNVNYAVDEWRGGQLEVARNGALLKIPNFDALTSIAASFIVPLRLARLSSLRYARRGSCHGASCVCVIRCDLL